ncbi:hypothetical protein RIF29_29500 [Crotalaria pallida]|uniref:F-box domain-containing protein n=1 Tax=Crotalaria pallida TaxID=3830 RepID=A0AAN9EEM6_CROPI
MSQGKRTDVDDHISKLPGELLSHILTFLNVKKAIGTKLVSRKWRDLSLYRSVLVLDYTLINIGVHDDHLLDSMSLPQKYQFVEQVNRVFNTIKLHKPLALTIWFPLGRMFSSYIDNWVSLAIKMECEKIDLEFKFATLDYDDEPYNFPCHLLLSSKNSHLKRLSLCECQFNPTPEIAERLVTLKSITLVMVLMEANELDLILSSSLSLESLELIDCEVLTSLRICHQDLGLKDLAVTAMLVEANIELSIPNLEIFSFFGSLEDITFSRMNQLKSIELNMDRTYQKGLCQLFDELSGNAPCLEALFLSCDFPQYLCYPHNKNHTPKFDNLTHLELTAKEDYGWNMFTHMLYKSPQLKGLVIDKVCRE